MYDLITNILVLVIYGAIGLLIKMRLMESKGITYSLAYVKGVCTFKFSLGVYAGEVRIVRKPSCVLPWFVRRVYGWDVIVPTTYSEEEVNSFLLDNNPPSSNNAPHSKDLEVYREVVIRGNNELSCVAGTICTIQ